MKLGVFRLYIAVAVAVLVSVYAAADVPLLNSVMFGSGTLSEPVSVASSDFNGDTHPDLAVVNRVGETVSVFLGDGQGGFAVSSSYQVGTAPESIASADFNGDLAIDLVVCNGGTNSVQILLGDGHGSFTDGASIATGTGPVSVTPCFLAGDSLVDLAVLCSDTDN
ncbi:MAG: VCBS repeat-containing protein, partial [Candidatus Hydrogenedentes bacterium]|nr:VCBS repeat-containing protein [Candidatus Hydrogenedentota bacterium]